MDRAAGRGPYALEGRGITVSFGGQTIVEDVNVQVPKGEICCLIGRSGSGKTTILHTLAGLSTPDAGRVFLHGQDTTGTPGRVGYMLQKDLLLPHKRVIDNVALPLAIGGMRKKEAREKARGRFAAFGLEGTQDKWPHQLSGGMRQRAALLRTCTAGADCLLLDEPFSALDALTRTDIRNWFIGMVGKLGLSALVITHDVDEAVCLASRIFVLDGAPSAGKPSRIVAEVPVEHPTTDKAARGMSTDRGAAADGGEPADGGAFELSDSYLEAKRAVWQALDT